MRNSRVNSSSASSAEDSVSSSAGVSAGAASSSSAGAAESSSAARRSRPRPARRGRPRPRGGVVLGRRGGVVREAGGVQPVGFFAVLAHLIGLPGFRVGCCRARRRSIQLGLGHDCSLFPQALSSSHDHLVCIMASRSAGVVTGPRPGLGSGGMNPAPREDPGTA